MHVDAAPVRFLQHKGQRIVTRIWPTVPVKTSDYKTVPSGLT